jgi:hypothetical protein
MSGTAGSGHACAARFRTRAEKRELSFAVLRQFSGELTAIIRRVPAREQTVAENIFPALDVRRCGGWRRRWFDRAVR